MARGKTAVSVAAKTEPKENFMVITKQQLEVLTKASEQIAEARRALSNVDSAESLAQVGFIAGQAFFAINQAEDVLDELISELNSDDDDNSWGDLDI